MGNMDTVLMVGALGVGAFIIYTYKDQIFGAEPPLDEPQPSRQTPISQPSKKAADCAKYCNNRWCDSYRKLGCSGACAICSSIAKPPTSSSCPQKVYSPNCAGDCKITCWHNMSCHSGVKDYCVSGSGRCEAAAKAWLSKYGCAASRARINAYLGDSFYPHNERAMRVSIA